LYIAVLSASRESYLAHAKQRLLLTSSSRLRWYIMNQWR